MTEMTKELLKKICKEDKLYMTPSLNDKLYLNFKGFTAIENLDDYTGLKALFLEGNAIDTITLPKLELLRCLYLQQNMIWEISGLENAPNLDTLNLCNNNIMKVQNLGCCKVLSTLQLAHNRLEDLASVELLAECPSITSLDLSHNKLHDVGLLEVLKKLPNLACLYLTGNPFVSNLKNYRKTLIASLPELKYLDDRPVFETERRCAEAWSRAGMEGERAEREKCKNEERERERRNFEHMRKIREDAFRRRREAMGLPPGDTDPALDEFSDGEWEFEGEPEELVRAREKLAQFTARGGEEEPAELSEARRKLAGAGVTIQEATWQGIEGPEGEAATAVTAATAVVVEESEEEVMMESSVTRDELEDIDRMVNVLEASEKANVMPPKQGAKPQVMEAGPAISLDELD